MAPYAKYKVWVKPSSELSWMYGNSLLKVCASSQDELTDSRQAGLARMTDNTPQYQGVIVFNANDVAIGFGVAAKGTR